MEPLTVRRVRLRDFLSHADTVVEFGQGVNVLIGPNGAGKSGILEAIYFALTRKGWRTTQGRVRHLIREGRDSAEVTLEFRIGDSEYLVRRFIGRNRQDLILVNGKVAAQGKDQVTDYINSLLGLKIDQLDKVVLIPQGGITRLFTQLRGRERKEAIDKLLGLHIYQEVGEIIRKTPIVAEAGDAPTTFYPKKLSQLASDARRVREKLELKREQVMKSLQEVNEEIREVREKLGYVRARMRELEKKARKYEELNEALERARARKEALEARLRDTLSDAERLREALTEAEEEVRKLSTEAGELEGKARLASLRQEVEELGKLIEKEAALAEKERVAREHLNQLEEKRRRIEELESRVPGTAEELKERLGALLSEVEKLSDKRSFILSMLARVSERKESLKESLTTSKASLRERAERVSKALGREVPLESIEEVIESVLKEVTRRSEELEREASELNQVAGALRSGIEDARKKLELIMSSETPQCPLCGRPLTPEHRDRIIRELEGRIDSMEQELEDVRKRLEDVERRREEVRRVATLITPGLLDAVKDLRKRVAEAEEELEKLRAEEVRLNNELEALNDELRRKADEEAELRRAVRDAEILEELRKGFSREDYERVRKEVESTEKELREIRERMRAISAELASRVGAGETAPETLYERMRALIRGAEEAAQKLAEVRARLAEARARVERLREELAEKEALTERLREELAGVVQELGELEKEFEAVKEAREELDRLRGEETALRERLASLEQRRSSLIEEVERLRKSVEGLRKAFRVAYVASWLADKVFHRDGLPKKMRPMILRLLEMQVEKLVDRFNLGFQDVHIDEEYEVTLAPVDNPRVRRPITSLSGGEQVSVSMAVLLALFQVVSGSRIGFMALDEPTEYLDEERQRALVDLFRRFQGGRILPQLIVVTHDESIKEVADRIYAVEKVGGVSRVTPIEPGEWG